MTADAVASDIARAARGAAAVARRVGDDGDAAALTYVAVYACGFAGGGTDLERYRAVMRRWRDEAFLADIRRHAGGTVEVTDWVLTASEPGRFLVTRDGVRAYVGVDDVVAVGPVGEPVVFTAPRLRPTVMPGFVVRQGRHPLAAASEAPTELSRLYLNIRPTAAAWALGTLAERLDVAAVPHQMKVLAHPGAYQRRDACVVYVPSEREAGVVDLVRRAAADAGRAVLGAPVPRLTARVAPGIGLAHEPTDLEPSGRSHGQWVAGLFHEAARHTSDPRSVARRVRALIVEAGRDPAHPHRRGTGSADVLSTSQVRG